MGDVRRAGLAGALALSAPLALALGDFVRLDGESHEPVLLWGCVAAALLTVAVVVAWGSLRARRTVALVVAGVLVLLAVGFSLTSFRFVFVTGEAEYLWLTVGLVLLQWALLTERFVVRDDPARRLTPAAGGLAWAVATVVVVAVGFWAGHALYEQVECGGAAVEGCDVAVIGALAGSATAAVVMAVAWLTSLGLRRARRASP